MREKWTSKCKLVQLMSHGRQLYRNPHEADQITTILSNRVRKLNEKPQQDQTM